MKARLARPALRPALGWAMRRPRSHAMVQNPENAKFVESLGVRPERVSLVRGAGVDVRRFRPRPEPAGPVRVTMVSRLLWDKGVREFVDAAMLVRKARGDVLFTLVGAPDEGNPTSVPSEEVRSWVADGLVEWWGYREDVAEVLVGSHVAVLPSYYGEGIPKTLLEARGLRAADRRDGCPRLPRGGAAWKQRTAGARPRLPRARRCNHRARGRPCPPRRDGGGEPTTGRDRVRRRAHQRGNPPGLRTGARGRRKMTARPGKRPQFRGAFHAPPRGIVLQSAIRSPLAIRIPTRFVQKCTLRRLIELKFPT